jgi:hypothetical protein
MVGKTPHLLKFRQQKGLHKGDSPGVTQGRIGGITPPSGMKRRRKKIPSVE